MSGEHPYLDALGATPRDAFDSATRARDMLNAAGFTDADIRIEGDGKRWLVAVHGLGSGATDETDATMDEPHEVAAALLRGHVSEAVTADGEPATLWEDAPPISDAEAEAIAATVALFDDGGEAEQDLGHETHGETGEADASAEDSVAAEEDGGSHAADDGDDGSRGLLYGFGGEHVGGESNDGREAADLDADVGSGDPLDADFTTLEIPDELDEPDFGGEMLEANADLPAIEGADAPDAQVDPETGAQFIFGDNLEQMRTAAIGLVIRHARTLMPYWTTDEDAALRELRNYTMGVQVNGWPDDPARRAELDGLEATRRRINEIVASRDEKVEFLEGATREQVEAFDVEAGWP